MGIKDEFHQKAILNCINELLPKQPDDIGELSSDRNIGGENLHNLTTRSFNMLEKCGKCQIFLRGLLHQGLLCESKFQILNINFIM